ncbi:hypothetical protein ACOME3_001230 [Neoechinorhynchus agilis]
MVKHQNPKKGGMDPRIIPSAPRFIPDEHAAEYLLNLQLSVLNDAMQEQLQLDKSMTDELIRSTDVFRPIYISVPPIVTIPFRQHQLDGSRISLLNLNTIQDTSSDQNKIKYYYDKTKKPSKSNDQHSEYC